MSEATIRKLWLDASYRGSFTGAYNFYRCLVEDSAVLKLKPFTYATVLRALSGIATYQMSVRKKTRGPTRHVKYMATKEGADAFIAGTGMDMHIDLGQLPKTEDNYNFYVLMVDLFDNYLYGEALHRKSKREVLKAIKKIVKDNGLSKLSRLGCDEGGEFWGNRNALAKMGITLYLLKGAHKAFVVEKYNGVLKNRLMRLAREKFTNDWPRFLQQTILNINSTANRGLDGLVPAKVNTPFSDPLVRDARAAAAAKRSDVGGGRKVTAGVFKKDDFVYADVPSRVQFDSRSFHVARDMVYRVAEVDTSQDPPYYKLAEINGKVLKRRYYGWQMRAARKPFDPNKYMPVEKILDHRVVNKKPEVLVKWSYYGDEYNSWEPEANVRGLEKAKAK
jgi:hypothetical protein